MSFRLTVILIIVCVLQLFSQIATPPILGDGTVGDPYQIASLENLYWLASSPEHMDKYFIQTSDIDASETEFWDIEDHDGSPYTLDRYIGWVQIGKYSESPFTGSYDGQSYIISNLYFNFYGEQHGTQRQCKGLFGYVSGAEIKNIVLNDIDFTAMFDIGGIAGYGSCNIENCYVSGIIKSYNSTGGIIGSNAGGIIIKCVSDVNIQGEYRTGGIAGECIFNSTITDCYSLGSVYSSNYDTGGLIGYVSNSEVLNSYSIGKVVSAGANIGGLIGRNESSNITSCFWDVEISGLNESAGGIGKTTSEMRTISTFIDAGWDFIGESVNGTDDIWDIGNDYNYGYSYFTGGDTKLKPEVKTYDISEITSTGTEASSMIFSPGGSDVTRYGVCWDTEPEPDITDSYTEDGTTSTYLSYNSQITGLSNGSTYYVRSYAENSYGISYGIELTFTTLSIEPVEPSGSGTEIDPYQIVSLENLYWLTSDPLHFGYEYLQTTNIDASRTALWYEDSVGTFKGWLPIGNIYEAFTGNYDGQGYSISNIFINRDNEDYVGLFGNTTNADIRNLTIENSSIIGQENTGMLVGCNNSSIISNCQTNGDVTSNADYIGGLIGWNHSGSNISGSSFSGSISGNEYTGGLIGFNEYSYVSNCSTIVNLNGDNYTGGLIGENKISTILESCSKGSVNGSGPTGGLIGYNLNHPLYGTPRTLLDSFSECDVNCTGTTGGLIGLDSYTAITDCYAIGNIIGGDGTGGIVGSGSNTDLTRSFSMSCIRGEDRVGGLIGSSSDGSIIECYFSGLVEGFSQTGGFGGRLSTYNIENSYSAGYVSAGSYTGGAVGDMETSTILNCYSYSKVEGDDSTGGLVGSDVGSGITSSFWNTETSGQLSSGGGTGITTSEMRNATTFTDGGWDLSNIWTIDLRTNFGFPYLNWQQIPLTSLALTLNIEDKTTNSVTANGAIINIGNTDPIEHGFCWNKTGKPTIVDNKVQLGSIDSTGLFNSSITSLIKDTTYYLRAFATNSSGINYGTITEFKTLITEPELPVGNGTLGSPYVVSTMGNLYWIAMDEDRWDKHYIQDAWIDASETSEWENGAGWLRIGTGQVKFTGSYDGGGFAINGLVVNRAESPNGFFGLAIGAKFNNIILSNISITTLGSAGGLVGAIYSSSEVNNCCCTGFVSGGYYVGGLVGKSDSSEINRSSSTGTVNGIGLVGGLVGWNYTAQINDSYSLSFVTGRDRQIGGFVGRNNNGSGIYNCYSAGQVTGVEDTGGFAGTLDDAVVENSFWDTETSGMNTSIAGIGKKTYEMKTLSTFIDAGWDFLGESVNGTEDIWDIDPLSNDGYPYLWWITTDINDEELGIPSGLTLMQNYPNPFNPETSISFYLPTSCNTKLSIYNSNGQLVKRLIDKGMEKGSHAIKFSGEDLNSGLYLYRIETGDTQISKKMLLIK